MIRLTQSATKPLTRSTINHLAARLLHPAQGVYPLSNFNANCLSRQLSLLSKSRKSKLSFSELVNQTNALISSLDEKKISTGQEIESLLFHWVDLAKSKQHGIAAADQARYLLDALRKQKIKRNNQPILDGQVLHAYAVCGGGRQAAEASQNLLKHLLDDCRNFIDTDCGRNRVSPSEPSLTSFNCAMQVWAKSGETDAGEKVEEIIKMMVRWRRFCQSYQDRRFQGCLPDERSLVALIGAWSFHQNGPERALRIVMDIMTDYQLSRQCFWEANLDAHVFTALMQAWTKSGNDSRVAMKVEQIFSMMTERGIKPDKRSYSILINAWANAARDGSVDAIMRAEDILNDMIARFQKGSDVKPATVCFDPCFAAWSRCSDFEDAPERVEHLYSTLLSLYEETNDRDFAPSVRTAAAIITTWGRAVNRPEAMDRALEALKEAKRFDMPDIVCFNSVIDAYARRGRGRDARHLLDWLLHQANHKGLSDLQPNIKTYTCVLSALAKDKSAGSAECAEEILTKMKSSEKSTNCVTPNSTLYSITIDAWSQTVDTYSDDLKKQKGAAERAEKLLFEMIFLFRQGDTIRPTLFSFNSCIAAWSRCILDNDAPERAERLIDVLLNLFEETGDLNLKPDSFTASSVVTAWSRAVGCPGSMNRAMAIMRRLEQYTKPNFVCITAMLDGFAKRGLSHEARHLYDWLVNEATTGNLELRPNTITCNCVLSAYAKDTTRDTADDAVAFLEEMKKDSKIGNKIKPNAISYTCVLEALVKSKSDVSHVAEKSIMLVCELMSACADGDEDSRPNLHILITFLTACSRMPSSNEVQMKVSNLVCSVFEALDHDQLQASDYKRYASAISTYIPDELDRLRLSNQIFQFSLKEEMSSNSLKQ